MAVILSRVFVFIYAKKTAIRGSVKCFVLEMQHFLIVVMVVLWECGFMNRIERGQMSRRERQIMDILYRLGQASAKEVQDSLPDPPSYSAVRALMVTLETKGMVRHSKESRRYIYKPVVTEKRARRSAMANLLSTFFEGRPEKLVAALLDPKDMNLDKREIERIRKALDEGS